MFSQSSIARTVLLKTMNSRESMKQLLAASGGDAVKLFDVSQNQCLLTYSPSPGLTLNSVKWNHNNMVLASAGDDGRVSLWKKNGQSLWTVPTKNDWGGMNEPSESISSINFCNKGSRYLCSGGTGQVVRIWDLLNKGCVKWLKGHTDAITDVMYNCKDEHIASISQKGDIIVHNLASGARAAELKDPNGQALGALDYSRMSRHLLVTAGDDGSVHLWDTTGRSPKVSWLKQHSAPTSGVSFSPSSDKSIASVGLDMKLYTFDTGSRKPSSCISYEAPFSSLAFADNRLTLAAGTTTGQVVLYDIRGKPQPLTIFCAYSEAVKNLCWQSSKLVTFDENKYTDAMVLLAGDIGDTILMPDPLPSKSSSGSSGSTSRAIGYSSSEKSPRSSLLKGLTLAKLHAPNVKDDMDVFSPLVEVQPLTPSTLDKLWDDHDSSKKDQDRSPSFGFPSQKYGLPNEGVSNNHPILDWKSNSASKQSYIQSQPTSNFSPTRSGNSTSVGERFLDKFVHRKSSRKPSRFAVAAASSSPSTKSLLPELQDGQSTSSLTSDHMSQTNLHSREASHEEIPSRLKNIFPSSSPPRKFSSYAERPFAHNVASSLSLGGSPRGKKTGLETREELLNSLLGSPKSSLSVGSPKSKKTGQETGEELLNRLLAKTQSPTTPNGGDTRLQETNYLEQTLASFQDSIHGDIHNLHLEILRQFHTHEMEMSSVMRLILENQAEIMKEIQLLGEETQHLHQLLGSIF
ncbi:hypothetical protein ACS0TY_024478 [Phlomoides rotata]